MGQTDEIVINVDNASLNHNVKNIQILITLNCEKGYPYDMLNLIMKE